MADKEIIKILTDKRLKVTPQRVAILQCVMGLDNHPSAEEINEYIRINYPHVPISTVYKILSSFIKAGIARRVSSDSGIIRFEPVERSHHHLYCSETERIEDYFDDELDKILSDYFKKKKIPDFAVRDFMVQINGKFKV